MWQVANGDGPRDHQALKDLNLPPLGMPGRPAPLVTKTLLFIGEGSDAMPGRRRRMLRQQVPRLRQGDRKGGLGDRAAGRHHRRADDVSAQRAGSTSSCRSAARITRPS